MGEKEYVCDRDRVCVRVCRPRSICVGEKCRERVGGCERRLFEREGVCEGENACEREVVCMGERRRERVCVREREI